MGYIGSDPKTNESVSTAQLVDDSVTNAKIVDNVLFTSVTSSVVSASGTITADTFTGTFSGALSSSAQIATSISGSSTSLSSSLATRTTTLESASGSFSTRVTTIEGSGTAQGVGTSDSPTFNNITATGTVTAQEFHSEFVSASIIFTSGSTKFGDSADDIQQMTGSLRITGSGDHYFQTGNVGIGTTSPNTTLTLSDGTDEFDFGVTTNQLMIKSVTSDGSDDQRIIIDAGNGGQSSTRGAYIALSGNEASSEAGKAIYQTGNVSGASHVFRISGGSDALTIDSSKNVGIAGSPDAVARLKVVGDSSDYGILAEQLSGYGGLSIKSTTVAQTWSFIANDNSGNSDLLLYGGSSAGTKLTIDSSGNVGIGVSSNIASKLHVYDTITVGVDTVTHATIRSPEDLTIEADYNNNSSGGNLIFKTDGSTALTIDSSQRVGIGTTNPTGLLEVANTSGNADIRIRASNSGHSRLYFGDVADVGAGFVDYDHGTDMRFGVEGSTRMTIDSSGDVGIGVTSPSYKFQVVDGDDNGSVAFMQDNYTGTVSGTMDIILGFKKNDGNFRNAVIIRAAKDDIYTTNTQADGRLEFYTTKDGTSTQRMRIDSTGRIMFFADNGITAPTGTDAGSGTLAGGAGFFPNSVGRAILYLGTYNYTSAAEIARFTNQNGTVGTISVSGTSTAFNTSSDYRLKENEVLISDGLTRLNQLKPYRFNFIADADTTLDGFFAHEVADVVPEAIMGEKDAVDADGNIKAQSIDHSKLVPLLVKALQEADDKIDALTARIEALES